MKAKPTLTQDWYKQQIPANAKLITIKADGSEAYTWREGERYIAWGFTKRAAKPAFRFWFATEGARKDYILRWIEGRVNAAARKAELAKERNKPHAIQAGDIFRDSWGYEQTNIQYFEVVEVKGAFVVVREIGRQVENKDWSGGDCIPAPGNFIGNPEKRKVINGNQIKYHSFSHATLMKPISVAGGVKIYKADSYTTYA